MTLQFGSEEKEHNFSWSDGERQIDSQVHCRGCCSITLRSEIESLIAMKIGKTVRITLLVNGPGRYVWRSIVHQKDAQKYISSTGLLEAQKEVNGKERQIPIVENIFDS